jgi:hypothetical protein
VVVKVAEVTGGVKKLEGPVAKGKLTLAVGGEPILPGVEAVFSIL